MRNESLKPVSIRHSETHIAAFSRALGESFARHGFAVVSDHGIDPATIGNAFDCAKAFFALPDAVKRRYFIPGGGGQRGYTPFGIEAAKGAPRADLKEFWHVGRDRTPSVAEIPGFDSRTRALFDALDRLGVKILAAIALYLELTADFFDDKVAMGNSILRLLHYPPVPPGTDAVRAGAHEDINVITLLLGAEEAGLELLSSDGTWLPVDPPPDCVVVNIGDMLQRLTNDVLPSTTHRVVNPRPERASVSRYSMPFFLHFESDYLIETLPGRITPERPDRYPVPVTADAYLRERLSEIKLI